MGVPDLWRILMCCSTRRPSSDLHGMVVAVDTNLWIQQALRSLPPTSTESAVVLVLVQRLLRMLGAGIRPVFVFDGPAPAAKRRVIERRKRRQAAVSDELRVVARKLVVAKLAQVQAGGGAVEDPERSNEADQSEPESEPPSGSDRSDEDGTSSTEMDTVPSVVDASRMEFAAQRRLLRRAQKRLHQDRWERSAETMAVVAAHDARAEAVEQVGEEPEVGSDAGLRLFSSMQMDNFLSHAQLKKQVEELRTAVSRTYRQKLAGEGASLCRSDAGVDVRQLEPIRSDATEETRRYYYFGPRRVASLTGRSSRFSERVGGSVRTHGVMSPSPAPRSPPPVRLECSAVPGSPSVVDRPSAAGSPLPALPPSFASPERTRVSGTALVPSPLPLPQNDSDDEWDEVPVSAATVAAVPPGGFGVAESEIAAPASTPRMLIRPTVLDFSDAEDGPADQTAPAAATPTTDGAAAPATAAAAAALPLPTAVTASTATPLVVEPAAAAAPPLPTLAAAPPAPPPLPAVLAVSDPAVSAAPAQPTAAADAGDYADALFSRGTAPPPLVGGVAEAAAEEVSALEQRQLNVARGMVATGAALTAICDGLRMALDLCGVPHYVARGEADAELGALSLARTVDAVATEDADAFLFGARRVLRALCSTSRGANGHDFTDVSADRVRTEIGLQRRHMVALAMMLGSDYTEGLRGVGPVAALRLLLACSPEGKCADDEAGWVFQLLREVDAFLDEARLLPGACDSPKGDTTTDSAQVQCSCCSFLNATAATECTVCGSTLNQLERQLRAAARKSLRRAAASGMQRLDPHFPNRNAVDAYVAVSGCSGEDFSWSEPDWDALQEFCINRLLMPPPDAAALVTATRRKVGYVPFPTVAPTPPSAPVTSLLRVVRWANGCRDRDGEKDSAAVQAFLKHGTVREQATKRKREPTLMEMMVEMVKRRKRGEPRPAVQMPSPPRKSRSFFPQTPSPAAPRKKPLWGQRWGQKKGSGQRPRVPP
eukprot:TRINITY_DN2978_c1_g2_i1.p1 TRINITY_DN2978_c1_g2~~TRINITY_DN2978_c1_g2_i1.p1  ORF type:complete len:1019 (+),score=258.32 TRINITY_DN2978_c1_g2_i1:64-3057(+)